MRYLSLILLATCMSGCQSHQAAKQLQANQAISTLDAIDFKKDNSFIHRRLEQ